MALTEIVQLDILNAQRQIDRLEQQLASLGTPIDVPVDVTGDNELERVRRELGLSDNAAERLNQELAQTDSELRQAGTQAKRTGDDIERAGRRGATAFSGLRGTVVGLLGAFGAVQGARAFLGFASESIQAASDLEESTSKAQVVFGEFFDEIENFAQTGPQALGLANAQALEFTGTFGNLFVALGLSQQAAADLAPDIVQLGADLASFNNIEVTDALDKLRAGLVGESEPLRVLGVNLTAASTAAKAVELGLAASTTEVSEAAKVQARYAQILEQTTTSQGDFARTADGIANTQRTLAAEFENMRAAVGDALLPAFGAILEITPGIVQALEETLVPALAGVASSIESVDTGGFISFLAGLPSGIQTAGSQLSSGAQAFGNAFQVFGSIAMLDFGNIGDQFAQLGDDIQDFRGAGAANEAVQTLIQTLATGQAPASALEATLKDLGESVSSLTVGQFEGLAAQLVAMATAAGATPQELRDLALVIRELGEDAGFSAAGVGILTDELLGPWGQAMAEASSGDIITSNLAASMAQAGAAAAESGPLISGFGLDAEEGMAAAERAAERAENTATTLGDLFGDLDVSDQVGSVAETIGKLPDALDGAAAAMKTKEDEIRTDFTGFLDDLEGQLADRQDFSSDIAALRDLSFDDLADAFATQGLEAAALLADAVANPEEAARAEKALDQFAVDQATSFRDQMKTELEEALDLTVPLNVTAVIQALNIRGFDDFASQIDRGNDLRQRNESDTGPRVEVNQYFDNTPGPNTETARALQQVNAMVN